MTQAAIAARRAVRDPISEAVHHRWRLRIPGWEFRASSVAGRAGSPSACAIRAADGPYGTLRSDGTARLPQADTAPGSHTGTAAVPYSGTAPAVPAGTAPAPRRGGPRRR
ncbi:hypothetical protein GCM10010451_49690 [Streptomyces virens]|uniref:Uncharacterized protein n=1 Tax=Streptomyces virens TaxID=285572 RepID=A0ABP6Q208_9ACTN